MPGTPRDADALETYLRAAHKMIMAGRPEAAPLMNCELSAVGQCRLMIPLSYRDEYLSALRALSQNANPTPIWSAPADPTPSTP